MQSKNQCKAQCPRSVRVIGAVHSPEQDSTSELLDAGLEYLKMIDNLGIIVRFEVRLKLCTSSEEQICATDCVLLTSSPSSFRMPSDLSLRRFRREFATKAQLFE